MPKPEVDALTEQELKDTEIEDEKEELEDKKKPKTSFFSNPVMGTVEGVREFAVESARLLNKCEKPDSKEFMKIAKATSVGFLIMGFVGFLVKIIHIPINNILIGNMQA